MVSHAVSVSHSSSLMSLPVFCSTGLESYSALLTSLQELIHKKGFDLATPMVRRDGDFGSSTLCVASAEILLRRTCARVTPPHLLVCHIPPTTLPCVYLSLTCSIWPHLCAPAVCVLPLTHIFLISDTFQQTARNVHVPSVSPGPNVTMSAKRNI